jgi:predicted dienelactone hydrolase
LQRPYLKKTSQSRIQNKPEEMNNKQKREKKIVQKLQQAYWQPKKRAKKPSSILAATPADGLSFRCR